MGFVDLAASFRIHDFVLAYERFRPYQLATIHPLDHNGRSFRRKKTSSNEVTTLILDAT
jgi:hypothetical protein